MFLRRQRTKKISERDQNSLVGAIAVLVISMSSMSCSSLISVPERHKESAGTSFQFEDISNLSFGLSMNEVSKRFGLPQKAFFLPDNGDYVFAYQQDPLRPQRYFLQFDHEKKQLVGKSYEPLPGERIKVFQAIKAAFNNAEFYSPPVSMCGSHFPMNDGLVYILGTGVTLRLHPKTRNVELISWVPFEVDLRRPAQLPTGCPDKKPVVPAEEILDIQSLF